LTGCRAEHERLCSKEPSSLEELCETSLRFERDASRFRVLRVLGGNDDLVSVPEDVTVLDLQHFTKAAARFERADDSIAHLRTRECVFRAIELVGGVQELPLFVRCDPAIA